MAITRWRGHEWSPFRELVRLQSEMDRLFGLSLGRRERFYDYGVSPTIDLYTDDSGHLRCKVELPGVKKDDVEITTTENTLTIRGKKRREREVSEENYQYSERSFGEFERTIELPTRVDAGKVEATYSDGVIDISLPVREPVESKQIEVKVR